MNIIKFIISRKFSLILIAVLTGIYLSTTFYDGNSWQRMINLIKDNAFVNIIVILSIVHLFMNGIYMLCKERMRKFASGILIVSIGLIISGIYLSTKFREYERFRVGTSDRINGFRILSIDMEIPEKFLLTGEVGDFEIHVKSALMTADRDTVILKQFPFSKINSGFYYINDAGISPNIELDIRGKKTILSNLDILPPGRTASILLAEDYKVDISLHPSREFKKGRLTAREYSLKIPQYRVVIKKGNSVIIDRIIGDRQEFSDKGMLLKLIETEKWIEIANVRDNGFLIVYLGIFGITANTILFPLQVYLNRRKNSSL